MKIVLRLPYNTPSSDLGGFREIIKPGAFTRSLRQDDIRALWNHDPNWVLGRTSNGTLVLRDTPTALEAEITLDPQDPMHASWAARVERGDVNAMSFGFEKVLDNWTVAADGTPLRNLLECRLFDISPVTFPAYDSASAVASRGLQAGAPGRPLPARSDDDLRRILRHAERVAAGAPVAARAPAAA